MPVAENLRTSLNKIRETIIKSNALYQEQVVEIMPDTDIGTFGAPLLSNPDLMNEFLKQLVQRIAYTQIDIKMFNNPLRILEGDQIPLGAIGQEIFINPAKGRKFNIDDFAGLLARYDVDVKVEYPYVNSDIQYPATITRDKLRNAFTSWANLQNFVDGITQSLYNGAYIDRYNLTKGLITSAYNSNSAKIEVVDAPTSESLAKLFIQKARTIFLNMQTPTSNYNAWKQVGGYGKDVITWSDPEDIVFLIRNDLASYIDVNVLANAFNIEKASLLGKIIYVNDFDIRDEDNNVAIDGSNIFAFMGDRKWFRIKNQEFTMDEFFNPNNKTYQIYLNDHNMFKFSHFANGVIFASEAPEVDITSMEFAESSVTVKAGEKVRVSLSTTPAQANSPAIEYTSSAESYATVSAVNAKQIEITGVAEGSATITATAGNVTTTISVTVTAS